MFGILLKLLVAEFEDLAEVVSCHPFLDLLGLLSLLQGKLTGFVNTLLGGLLLWLLIIIFVHLEFRLFKLLLLNLNFIK